jgi:hypothetical protein
MIFAEATNSALPTVVLSVAAFTGALLVLAGLTYVYLSVARSVWARKATFALLLLSGSGVFLAFLYALSPGTLSFFPLVGGLLFLICAVTYFTSRFCPHCGRPTYRYRLGLPFTHCPYCGHSYAPTG